MVEWAVDFGVLGPVVAHRDGVEIALGGPKQRALLAMLLLNANRLVGRDRLIDGIWGEHPPATAEHTLDNYVSRLRKALDDGRLARGPGGYVLRVEPGELDLDRFEEHLMSGRELMAAGAPAEAVDEFRSALALSRGPALGELRYEPFGQPEAERLEERRLQAIEEQVAAELELGAGSGLVAELGDLVREQPFRERLLGALMLALYRAGRQAEALETFQAARRRFAAELGLQPGPGLEALQRRILEHDPALTPASRRAVPRRPHTRRRIAPALVAVAVVLVATLLLLLRGDGPVPSSAAAGESSHLVELDRGGRPGTTVALGDAAAAAVSGFESVWLALPGAAVVARVDPDVGAVVDSVPVGGAPALLAVGDGAVWAASGLGDRISRIDPRTGAVTQTIALGAARAAALAFGAGRLWVADAAGDSVLEVDPSVGELRRNLELAGPPGALAVSGTSLWVADYGGATVAQVDLHSGRTLATVHVGGGPTAIAAAADSVWVANALDSTVSRIQPRTASVVATIPVGSGPSGLVVAADGVWASSQYARTASHIDPRRNAVTATARLGGGPTALALLRGRPWAATRPLGAHRGGTLVLLHTRPLNIDPALNVDALPLQADALAYDGLLTYRRAPGSAGTEIVPDLAVSVPSPTDGGRTYTFRLRPGIRYSDGRPLRAADLRRGIERTLRLGGDSGAQFAGIAGIETDEEARTVTFHLDAADPGLPAALTLAAASAVPAGTPDEPAGHRPIPGTGPYGIVRASDREVRWERNPYFREWSHAAQPDGNPDAIVMRLGASAGYAFRAVEAGRADWSLDNVPAAQLSLLRRRHPQQLHGFTIPTTDFGQFNTRRAPLDDLRVRRAVNLAIDRRRIARMYGGAELATPTCQILPPGIPGYRHYCPYAGPDLVAARRLIAASGTRGDRVVLWSWTDDPTITPQVARYVTSVLRDLGYRASTRLVTHAALSEAS